MPQEPVGNVNILGLGFLLQAAYCPVLVVLLDESRTAKTVETREDRLKCRLGWPRVSELGRVIARREQRCEVRTTPKLLYTRAHCQRGAMVGI